MKPGILRFSVFVFFTLCLFNCFCQQTVLSAGGEASGSTGTVSYSIGQLSFMTLIGDQGVITEGAQQPYEILFNSIHEAGISLQCKAWPNPASTYLLLSIENHEIKNLSYRLYTLNGILLKDLPVKEKNTKVSLDIIAPGTYILTVTENGNVLNSYKIIKK